MIPDFPIFKKIELPDKGSVDSCTEKYPPYSDFEFASLWSWDVKGEMGLSLLNGNLVVRFTDYVTGDPFYSFLGDTLPNETAEALLAFSHEQGYKSLLNLVPEISAQGLDRRRFLIEESRDHFDYVCDITRYITYSGTKLKSKRNFLNGFHDRYPDHEVSQLDLEDPAIAQTVTELYRRWEKHKGFFALSEAFAYERFLEAVTHFSYTAIGIRFENELIACHISSLPKGTCANGLFEKADMHYHGIYAALMHEVAKDLVSRGYTALNYEQDLGIENLRKSKKSLDPAYFLKKYTVSEISL